MEHKETAGVIAPPPLIYAAGGISGLLLQAAAPIELLPAWSRWVGLAVLAVSFIPGVWAVWVMLRAGTSPEPWHPTRKLVVHGPFAYSRNPIYLSFTLFLIGLGLFAQNVWILAACVIVLVVIHYGVILREERYLERLFGEAFREYRRRVRRWI